MHKIIREPYISYAFLFPHLSFYLTEKFLDLNAITLTRMVIGERGGLIAVYFITLSDHDRDVQRVFINIVLLCL